MGGRDFSLLVRFNRMISEASSPEEIIPLLVNAAIDPVGADGAVVLRIEASSLVAVAARGLPELPTGFSAAAETMGPELGERLVEVCGARLRAVAMLPIVSSGDLYGVLVLLHTTGLDPAQVELAEALADLAALSFGKAIQYAELARSYAELRDSREAMARTEKLRLLGQMAAGISHDLKNILNPLALQLQLVRRRLDDRDALLELIGRMGEVIQAGVQVVDRLRAFSSQETSGVDVVDVNGVVATAAELARPRLGERPGVALHVELGAPPPVRSRSAELISAIVSLVLNATEAMTRGAITIRTGADAGGGFVEVADDGPGMPPEVEARAFEPFFTTKPEGTGLGLATIYAFVERTAGKIVLETAPGRGTRIRLWFPAA